MARDACIDSGGALPSPPHVFSPPHAVDAHLRRLGSSPNLLELEYEEWIRRAHSLIVPPTLHQSWQACGPLLPDHARWRARCARVLPANWTLFLWSDDANRRLVQTFFPSFLSTYDGYDSHIKRVDAARYFYLYLFGGVYIDLDVHCLRPFEALPLTNGVAAFGHLEKKDLLFDRCCRRDIGSCANATCVRRRSEAVPNAFMAAPPRHPLFAALILDLSSAKDVTYKNRSSPLAATGPIYLANRLYEWARRSRKRHVHIHEAGRIYGSPWLETGTHRFPRAHPCSFDAPRARIARLEALKCNASQRFYSAARCAEVRSWPQVVENDERLIDARPDLPERLACARKLNGSITSSFWTASWIQNQK
mmetsp:Transcript_5029/g.16141  ORF Transcript_5029/g.16141 Transcript_5029/m.16141 type:complete len:364 (-) Transcript_5029:173-1264(-)